MLSDQDVEAIEAARRGDPCSVPGLHADARRQGDGPMSLGLDLPTRASINREWTN